LWVKARLKAMSRWFIWEQVNFNSAVHHALAETLHALAAYQQELAALRVELARQAEVSRAGFERRSQELTTVRVGLEAQTAELKKENTNLIARNAAGIETRVTEMAAELTRKIDEARADLTPRLAELAGELRESDQQLREEQRVCFKQLSLEASETAVDEDRGLRLIETRLDKLEKALSNGAK
jgi:flagellar biosynthesis GTPase FlhF